MKLTFLGAAGTVTGSKILIEEAGSKILIDCGLFQGLKNLRLQNWTPFPVDPGSIDCLLLTHAHLDHCGYIPRLVAKGFSGAIHCTPPTQELTEIILKDSAKIQMEEAERANRYGYTKHKPAKPLYDLNEVINCLPLFQTHQYHEWVILNEHFKFRFRNAGHILGSCMIELKAGDKKIIFSGDMGRTEPMLLPPPEYVKEADYLILESTYGDRLHPTHSVKAALHDIIWETYSKKGILLIPTFAVERAQELLHLLAELKEENRLPGIPIYLDSPMGVNATKVLLNAESWHTLDREEVMAMNSIADLISNVEASKAIVADDAPKIVLAGSGMLSGGRILHYLARHISKESTTLLLAGFMAAGTRGRALAEGAEEIKLFGKYYKVKASVKNISGLSAHADQHELLSWARHIKTKPQVFLNHGEPHAADTLRAKMTHELGWSCQVAEPNVGYAL